MVNVVLMADLTGSSLNALPAGSLNALPKLAGYVTGSGGIQWSAGQLAAAAASHGLVRIDQSPGLAEFAAGRADVADIEALAGTPAGFAAAVEARLAGGHDAGAAYGSDGPLAQIGQLLAAAPPRLMPDCWLANWNLNLAAASALIGTDVHGMLCQAVQWASPTSNPRTFLPGTTLTLVQANADLSAAAEAWHPAPGAPAGLAGIVVYPGGVTGLAARPVSSTDNGTTWR